MKDLVKKLTEVTSEIDYLLNSEGVCISREDADTILNVAAHLKLTIESAEKVMPLQITGNSKVIKKGTIVEYQKGWCKVTAVFKDTVNLGAVFGNSLYHKGIPKSEVKEDEEAFYENWRKSESYQCM